MTGFVYILLNPSFPNYVKIGLTRKTSEERARELRTTGVPTNFIVIYDELVTDCKAVESAVHKRFASYRVTNDREFFHIPVKEAICALQEEATKFRINSIASNMRVEILPVLKQMYMGYLKPDIISVRIVQPPGICFLEVIRNTSNKSGKEIVEREDLDIFGGGENGDSLFPPMDSVEENAARFIGELTAYDYIMTGMPLFTEEAEQQIANHWER